MKYVTRILLLDEAQLKVNRSQPSARQVAHAFGVTQHAKMQTVTVREAPAKKKTCIFGHRSPKLFVAVLQ